MSVERNKAKKKLQRGELVTIVGNFETSDMIDFVGSLELFDSCWIDMEHSPVTWANLADFSRAADIWGMSSIVRVRDNDAAMIALALAEGVDGILIPHVNSKAEAEAVVDAAKFTPLGNRGMSGGRRSYGRADHYARANDETFVGVLIEDVKAVERITEILEVDHIDVFFVARYDLSQSMGFAGEPRHPDVVAMSDRALRAIVAAGRTAGAGGAPAELDKYLEMGVGFLKVPDWRAWISAGATAYRHILDTAVEQAAGKAPA